MNMDAILKILCKLGLTTKKGLATAFAFMSLLIDPIVPLLITVYCVVMLDLYTGIKVSIKAKKEQAKMLGVPFNFTLGLIKSNGLFKTLTKALDYLLFVIAGHFAQTYIVPEIPFVKIISGGIIGIEFWSIAENMHKLHGIDLISAIKRWFVSKDIADVIAPMEKKEEEVEDNKEK